eukprot:442735-Rhodomonas_salina.1
MTLEVEWKVLSGRCSGAACRDRCGLWHGCPDCDWGEWSGRWGDRLCEFARGLSAGAARDLVGASDGRDHCVGRGTSPSDVLDGVVPSVEGFR